MAKIELNRPRGALNKQIAGYSWPKSTEPRLPLAGTFASELVILNPAAFERLVIPIEVAEADFGGVCW
jgi:hypothetical protein